MHIVHVSHAKNRRPNPANRPLGIDELKISAFEIEFEFLIVPPPALPVPTLFAIRGAGCLGQNEGEGWCAGISIFADVTEPVYFFSGRFDGLNLKQIAGAFDTKRVIPDEVNDILKEFGFEELDLEVADAPGAIINPPTLQRHDGTEVVIEGGYFQATVKGLQAGIIQADYASFFFERTPEGKVSVETAISLPKTQVSIPQLDWLNPNGGFTVTFGMPESSELLVDVEEFLATTTGEFNSNGPFFYLKAASEESPVIAFGADVEFYVLDAKVKASVTGIFREGELEASFTAKLEEVPIPDWMAARDAFAGHLEGWIDVDGNVFDNSGHFLKNAVTGGTTMIGDKAEETAEWLAWLAGRRRLFDSSELIRFGEIEVSWTGTIGADMLV